MMDFLPVKSYSGEAGPQHVAPAVGAEVSKVRSEQGSDFSMVLNIASISPMKHTENRERRRREKRPYV